MATNAAVLPDDNATSISPDIEYRPDYAKWQARTARRLREDPTLPNTPLPDGFPKRLDSPLVWEGKEWQDESQWVYELSDIELKEIDDAVRYFHSLNLPFGHISKATFPLPTLGNALTNLARELHSGRGFFLLRTIPVNSYSREDNILIYAGVSAWIAPLRGLQDKNGGVLSHIKDLTKTRGRAVDGPAYTTDLQVFHTDRGPDVVALFALETAAEGGASRISSGWRVYNELAESRPDLVKVLSEPWAIDKWNAEHPYTLRPLLYPVDSEKVIIQFSRRYFTGFPGQPRSTNIPPLSEAQAEALDALHFLAEKYHLKLNFQKGDMQYINNFCLFHARDGFRDEGVHTRHLLRLWLRNEELGWDIPEAFLPLWEKIFAVAADKQTFAIEPVVRASADARNSKG
ncbi:hypothetical protein H0H92_000456 [Tricholoma furcatifolium]|nr:hypothetical protein H0H92_000456 [Tricholoma furcatifolium]